MEIEEFENQLKLKAKELEIELNNKQIKQFYKYMLLLIEWNEKINLTAIVKPEDIILKHFIDSITISKYIKQGKTLIDVGSGAGFPGIPLKIIREDIKVTLLDSLNKRVNFLNQVIEELELEDIDTIHSRAEDAGTNKSYRGKFDVATSRAVANLSVLSEYMIPFVKVKGKVINMKASKLDLEIEESKKSISVLGGEIQEINEIILPGTKIKRTIVIINKRETTPSMYPRKAGIPSKEPIS